MAGRDSTTCPGRARPAAPVVCGTAAPATSSSRRSRSPPTSSTTTSPAPTPMRRARGSRSAGRVPPQGRLHGLGAAGRRRRGRGQPPPVEVPGRRRPAGQQRVPGELEHVPAGPGDQLQQRRNAPSSSPRSSSAPPGPRSASRSVMAVNPEMSASSSAPVIRSACGRPAPSGASGQPPHQPLRQEAGQRLSVRGHGDQLPLLPAAPGPAARQQVAYPAGWRTTSKWAWRKGASTP